MPIRHLVFDLFGTLADSDRTILITKRGRFMAYGATRWMIEDAPEETFFAYYAEQHGLDPVALKESFIRMERTTEFFDGIPELLTELSGQGFSLHLLSNCGRSVQDFMRRREDVFSLFATVTCSYRTGYAKPDPRQFRAALDAIGSPAEECCMIGDSLRDDISAAEGIGMRTIHFEGRREPVEKLRRMIAELA